MSLLALFAWISAQFRPTFVTVQASSGGSGAPPWLVVLGASLAAIVGAMLVHRYTLGRERRAELTKALDSLVQGYVAADRAFMDLRGFLEHGASPERVQAAADRVSDCETVTRGAHRSIALRLSPGHPVINFFEVAGQQYQAAWISLGPIMHGAAEEEEEGEEVFATSRQHYEWFHKALGEAVRWGRGTVGEVDRWRRRRHQLRVRLWTLRGGE